MSSDDAHASDAAGEAGGHQHRAVQRRGDGRGEGSSSPAPKLTDYYHYAMDIDFICCLTCGALVGDWELHREWHERVG